MMRIESLRASGDIPQTLNNSWWRRFACAKISVCKVAGNLLGADDMDIAEIHARMRRNLRVTSSI